MGKHKGELVVIWTSCARLLRAGGCFSKIATWANACVACADHVKSCRFTKESRAFTAHNSLF